MEMHVMTSSSPRTVEEIFKDYNARRPGIVRALTFDVNELYSLCDPDKENLCLYGHPNESWEVTLPAEEVPPELPEPALGINFARDGMTRRDWLSLIAVHSDSWLLVVAFYFGAQLNRNESEIGAHFSPCGRFLAACVACMLPRLEGDAGSHTQFHQDVMGAVATSPTWHPISAHQVMYELRIYSLEEAT